MNQFSKKQLIAGVTLIILIIAIPMSVFLAQKTQILKSRAGGGESFLNALEIKDSEGKNLYCDHSTNPPSCDTSTQDITIKVIDLDWLIKGR